MPGTPESEADIWMTPAEIADELRVNPATVRLWISKGQLAATRAGMRKLLIRRSDLGEMLATASLPARSPSSHGTDDAGASSSGQRPNPSRERAQARSRAGTAERAAALMREANRNLSNAFAASASARPSAGYTGRLRAVADGFEHVAATTIHAANTGMTWSGRGGIGPHQLPYELRPDGNRPRRPALWDRFDASMERLAVVMTGQDLEAVGKGCRQVGDELMAVARELENDSHLRNRAAEHGRSVD